MQTQLVAKKKPDDADVDKTEQAVVREACSTCRRTSSTCDTPSAATSLLDAAPATTRL
ncbi:hypothetical protein [Streptomyces sp. NPDC050564]|uniref:hypothetical protein n=1 Tax=Streptomyces sp. NPDC050564 TaxID=3365631 RepID=UPI0037B277BB